MVIDGSSELYVYSTATSLHSFPNRVKTNSIGSLPWVPSCGFKTSVCLRFFPVSANSTLYLGINDQLMHRTWTFATSRVRHTVRLKKKTVSTCFAAQLFRNFHLGLPVPVNAKSDSGLSSVREKFRRVLRSQPFRKVCLKSLNLYNGRGSRFPSLLGSGDA